MTTPVVELLVAPGTGDRLAPLARRLSRWCDVRAPDAAVASPAARLASSWRAPRLAGALADGSPPLALWVAGAVEADAASSLLDRCAVLLCDREEVAGHLRGRVDGGRVDGGRVDGGRVAVVAESAIDAEDHRPLTPFVRRRWRRRLGLADNLVIDARTGSASVSEPLVPSALAVAAAVVVDRRWVLRALALGAAAVVDRRTAEEVGATDGTEVVVADPHDAVSVAADLAGDVRRCAALGRAGRRLCERRFTLRGVAADVALRLGLRPERLAPDELLVQRLSELGTPAGARVAARARWAAALFVPVDAW